VAPGIGARSRRSAGRSRGRPRVVVATADSAILDRCPAWFNLARETVARHVPDARVMDLS